MRAFFDHVELFACISYLVPLIPGWVLIKKMTATLRLLMITLSVMALFSATGYYTGTHYIDNLWMYFAGYALTFYLFSWLFRMLLTGAATRWFIMAVMVLFTISSLVRLHTILTPGHFESYTPAFLGAAMMAYCVLFFNSQLARPQITFIYRTPWFWIITGLLLYYAGSFLILLTTNYLMVKDSAFSWELWNLLDLLSIIRNLLIATGFVFYKHRS